MEQNSSNDWRSRELNRRPRRCPSSRSSTSIGPRSLPRSAGIVVNKPVLPPVQVSGQDGRTWLSRLRHRLIILIRWGVESLVQVVLHSHLIGRRVSRRGDQLLIIISGRHLVKVRHWNGNVQSNVDAGKLARCLRTSLGCDGDIDWLLLLLLEDGPWLLLRNGSCIRSWSLLSC